MVIIYEQPFLQNCYNNQTKLTISSLELLVYNNRYFVRIHESGRWLFQFCKTLTCIWDLWESSCTRALEEGWRRARSTLGRIGISFNCWSTREPSVFILAISYSLTLILYGLLSRVIYWNGKWSNKMST